MTGAHECLAVAYMCLCVCVHFLEENHSIPAQEKAATHTNTDTRGDPGGKHGKAGRQEGRQEGGEAREEGHGGGRGAECVHTRGRRVTIVGLLGQHQRGVCSQQQLYHGTVIFVTRPGEPGVALGTYAHTHALMHTHTQSHIHVHIGKRSAWRGAVRCGRKKDLMTRRKRERDVNGESGKRTCEM